MLNYEARFWGFQGLVSGSLATFLLMLLFIGSYDNFIELKQWQTVIVCILTVLPAVATVFAIYSQISQVADRDEHQRVRANLAARASLAQPLSNLVAYQRECMTELAKLKQSKTQLAKVPKQFFEPPPYPASDIPYLVNTIITAEIPISNSISEIAAQLQYQHARLQRLARDLSLTSTKGGQAIVLNDNINSYILNAAEIHHRLDVLFPYARRDEENLTDKPLLKDITKCLWLSHLYEHDNPILWKAAKVRYE